MEGSRFFSKITLCEECATSRQWTLHCRCFRDNDDYVGKYSVTVQDPVSLVNGTVDLLSSSSDSCNLTVTCSTQDSHHINSTFRCDTNTCSQEEGGERSKVTTSGTSLRVYLSEGVSVICNHSNQVSSDEHITKIWDFCFSNPVPEPLSTIFFAFFISPVIGVLVIICIPAVYVGHRIKGKRESVDMKKTVYTNVQFKSVNPLLDQNPTDDAAAPSPSSELDRSRSMKSTEAGDTTQPESLYAQVDKSALA
ncbi:uncharacterized protein LOC124854443 [Hippoglossus stenolepis]|uniref:uncharacterized protein LOC124854443 n=1 Tax=Hippoglossus stenolepis TaxID=195615 RepID=UPI001FAEBC2D|nr:uncharacterized protein LOC124854443 [Hippoglossus stenolepis]